MNACRPEKQTQQDDVHYTANNNGLIHGINDIIMNIIMFRVPNSLNKALMVEKKTDTFI